MFITKSWGGPRPQNIDWDPWEFARDGKGDFLPLIECIDRGLKEEPSFLPVTTGAQNSDRIPAGPIQLTLFPRANTRALWKPNDAMREVHARANQVIRELGCGWPGSIWPDFLLIHQGSRYFYHVDLKDAFGSIQSDRLAEVLAPTSSLSFRWGADHSSTVELLQRYFMLQGGGLIQGGPSSSYLFQLYAHHRLDHRLYSSNGSWAYMGNQLGEVTWTYRLGLRYSRFADDLVFSSKKPFRAAIRKQLNAVIREAGFTVNPQKTRLYDLRRKPIVINGAAIRLTSHGPRGYLPRPTLRRIEGMLHLAETGRDVNWDEIHGLMGYFLSVTRTDRMNRSEERVLAAYTRLKPTH